MPAASESALLDAGLTAPVESPLNSFHQGSGHFARDGQRPEHLRVRGALYGDIAGWPYAHESDARAAVDYAWHLEDFPCRRGDLCLGQHLLFLDIWFKTSTGGTERPVSPASRGLFAFEPDRCTQAVAAGHQAESPGQQGIGGGRDHSTQEAQRTIISASPTAQRPRSLRSHRPG